MVTEQLYWRKNFCGCFRFIWLWLLISIMKRYAERCALQLYHTSLNEKVGHQIYSSILSFNRFIKRMITFDDSTTRNDRWKKDKFSASRELFEMFNKQCARNYSPDDFLAIDATRYIQLERALGSRYTIKATRLSMGSILEASEVQEKPMFATLLLLLWETRSNYWCLCRRHFVSCEPHCRRIREKRLSFEGFQYIYGPILYLDPVS